MTHHQLKYRFLSTLSLRRATDVRLVNSHSVTNFYPRSPCGERPVMNNIIFMPREFLSTLSLRRATPSSTVIVIFFKNFYPRSPCGERRANSHGGRQGQHISIHALLAESDVMHALKLADPVLFLSTLSLRRATKLNKLAGLELVFLSTLSLRRATVSCQHLSSDFRNFYPRSPCGERPSAGRL